MFVVLQSNIDRCSLEITGTKIAECFEKSFPELLILWLSDSTDGICLYVCKLCSLLSCCFLQGLIQEFAKGGGSSLSFPFSPLRSRPLQISYGAWWSAVSSPSGVRGGAPTENDFGALSSCQKATSGNHFEYSEYHVLRA